MPTCIRFPLRAACIAGALSAAALTACAVPPPGTPGPAGASGLPAIPAVNGPLRIDVVAPEQSETLPTRDSAFIYGSVGTGQARLVIDGDTVPVEPDGAFLAWLPVPADGVYRLTASAGGQTVSAERQVRLPAPPVSLAADRARILDAGASPTGAWTVQPRERIDVRFRGTPGGRATLRLPDGRRVPLVEARAVQQAVEGVAEFSRNQSAAPRDLSGVATYSGFFLAQPIISPDSRTSPPLLAPIPASPTPRAGERYPNGLSEPGAGGAAVLELVVGNDTARLPLPLTVAVLERPRVAAAAPAPADETHRGELVGRAAVAGPYNWFWPTGTRLALTGERNGMLRVALGDRHDAWVSASEVQLLPEGTPPPGSRVGTVRFQADTGWIDARLALSTRLPFKVDETLDAITLSVYGAQSETNYLQYGPPDPLVRYAEWRQQSDSVYTLTVHLTRQPWGYRTFFRPDGDLVLRIRRPPAIDAHNPLRGLTIALDPGHPPGGAVGPTRLSEKDANLQIALRLRPLLERSGARVVMTRTTDEAVPLNQRPVMATDSNADVLLSIHNNGLPNGVDPFGNTGTSDYYFHPHSAALAFDLDRALVAALGTRDLGPGRADLALVRPTWMPAVLTESLFLMVPRQEAALRDPAVQERIARAHLRGLEAFLRERARE